MTSRSRKGKRPSFQWYPGDHKRDTALQSCSYMARALWRDLLDIMHDGQPYGHLCINGKALQTRQVAVMVGLPEGQVGKLIQELLEAGVPSQTPEGVIYSRRMVKDEYLRNTRTEAGKMGGNPNLLPPILVNQTDNQEPNQNPHPPPNQKPTPAVAVAVAVASSSSASPDFDRLAAGMDELGRSALEGYLRGSPAPDRLLAELSAIASGLHGPGGRGVPVKELGRALHEMALVGGTPSATVLRGFIRRLQEGEPPPRNGQKPEEDLSEWAARKERDRVAKRA